MTRVYETASAGETEALGEVLGRRVHAGTVVALFGDLAAGKTAFIRGLARGIGISDSVTSPTFAIVHEYREGKLPLFHFDMYRLRSSEELYDIGWEDYLKAGGVCAVEWSENVADALPGDCVRVEITVTGDKTRRIEITGEDAL